MNVDREVRLVEVEKLMPTFKLKIDIQIAHKESSVRYILIYENIQLSISWQVLKGTIMKFMRSLLKRNKKVSNLKISILDDKIFSIKKY